MINFDQSSANNSFNNSGINKNILKKIVDLGGFPNKSDHESVLEAIQYALTIKGEKSEQWFEKHATEIDSCVQAYADPLIVKAVRRGNAALLTQCLQHGVSNSVLNMAFQLAVESENSKFVKILCSYGADYTTQIDDKDPLFLAARRNNLPLFLTLLFARKNSGELIHLKNDPLIAAYIDWTLMGAISIEDVEAVKVLVNIGADPFFFDPFSRQERHSAFNTAFKNNQSFIAAIFLGLEDCNLGCKDIAELVEQFLNALKDGGEAAMETMEKLLQIAPGLVDFRDHRGRTPLQIAVQKENKPLIKLLIDHGANINARLPHGGTLLHYAVGNGNHEILEFLFELKVNPNAIDKNGNTALHAVAMAWHRNNRIPYVINFHKLSLPNKMITRLIKAGADINAINHEGFTPSHFAVVNGMPEVLLRFIESGANVNVPDKYGNTPLHLAVIEKNKKAINLLKAKANINAKNHKGHTPLHFAVVKVDHEAMDLLIKSGADIHVSDEEGNTPLHLAVMLGNLKTINKLTDNGAKTDVKNHQGFTPWDYLQEGN
jgi:ankyrin repeat protein